MPKTRGEIAREVDEILRSGPPARGRSGGPHLEYFEGLDSDEKRSKTGHVHHSTRTTGKSYRVSALVGAGVANPVNLATVSRKSAAMKIARDFMRETKPKSEYDSVQILPLVRGERDWNTESIRWLGITKNVRRPTWIRGQGIK